MTDEMKRSLMADILARVGVKGIGQIVLEQHNTIHLAQQPAQQSAEQPEPHDDALVAELLPIFKNDRQQAAAFLASVDGLKPTAVTEKVNSLLREEKITRAGSKGDMWGVLHRYGLYKPSKQNWNAMVNA